MGNNDEKIKISKVNNSNDHITRQTITTRYLDENAAKKIVEKLHD